MYTTNVEVVSIQREADVYPCRISSGNAAACIGLDSSRTPYQLVRLLTGQDEHERPDPRDPNHLFNRGLLLERAIIPAAVMMIEQWLIDRGEANALPVTMYHLSAEPTPDGRGRLVRHPEMPAECHPDCVVIDAWGRVFPGDAKSSVLWDEYIVVDGELQISDRTRVQFHHIWGCLEASGEFGPLEPIFMIPVCLLGRYQPFQLRMMEIERWRCDLLFEREQDFLERHVWPLLDGQEAEPAPMLTLEDARLRWPQPAPGKRVTVDDGIAREVVEYWRDKSMVSAYEKAAETRLERIALAIEDAEFLLDPSGVPLAKNGVDKNGRRTGLKPWKG